MAVEKFNWHSTNPNTTFESTSPPVYYSDMVNFDATADETETAYNTLVNKGTFSDFKTKVWNDICAKVYDISVENDINSNYLNDSSYSPFIHNPSKTDWEEYLKEKYPTYTDEQIQKTIANAWSNYKPGILTARKYNLINKTWLSSINSNDLYVAVGDPVKSEYILNLVTSINSWLDANNLPFQISDSFIYNEKVNIDLISSSQSIIIPEVLTLVLNAKCGAILQQLAYINIELDLDFEAKNLPIYIKRVIHVLTDSNIMRLQTFATARSPYKITAYPSKLSLISNINLKMYNDIIMPFFLNKNYFQLTEKMFLYLGKIQAINNLLLNYYFDGYINIYSDNSKIIEINSQICEHNGIVKIRTQEELPIKIINDNILNSSMNLRLLNSILMNSEDNKIPFSNNTNIIKNTSIQFENDDNLGIKLNKSSLENNNSIQLEENKNLKIQDNNLFLQNNNSINLDTNDSIIYQINKLEYNSNEAVNLSVLENIGSSIKDNQQLNYYQSNPLSLQDKINSLFSEEKINLSFNGETNLESENQISTSYNFNLDYVPSISYAHTAKYITNEQIDLSFKPTLELGAEINLLTKIENSNLNKIKSIKIASDNIINSIISGELGSNILDGFGVEQIAAEIHNEAILSLIKEKKLEAISEVEINIAEISIARQMLQDLSDCYGSSEIQSQAELATLILSKLENKNDIINIIFSEPNLNTIKSKFINGEDDITNIIIDSNPELNIFNSKYINGKNDITNIINSEPELTLSKFNNMISENENIIQLYDSNLNKYKNDNNSLSSNDNTQLITDTSLALLTKLLYFSALSIIINIIYEVQLNKLPSSKVESEIKSSVSSQASVVVAKYEPILVTILEENSIIDEEEILVSNFERILTF